MGTSGVYFGSLKTLLLSVKLENIRIGTSLDIFGYSELENIRRIDIFVQVTCDLERMPMSRIVEKLSVLFLIQRSLPSWSYASRYLFKNDFYLTREFLILVFLTSRENQELSTFRSYNRSQGLKLKETSCLLLITYSNSQRKTHQIAQEPQKRQYTTTEVGSHLF